MKKDPESQLKSANSQPVRRRHTPLASADVNVSVIKAIGRVTDAINRTSKKTITFDAAI